jgi:predicted Ser/Thr protein kinase
LYQKGEIGFGIVNIASVGDKIATGIERSRIMDRKLIGSQKILQIQEFVLISKKNLYHYNIIL